MIVILSWLVFVDIVLCFKGPITGVCLTVLVCVFCFFSFLLFSGLSQKVLSGAGYTQKADLWSAGVIAFMLLCGSFPFLKDEADLNDKVCIIGLVFSFGFCFNRTGSVRPRRSLIGGNLKFTEMRVQR